MPKVAELRREIEALDAQKCAKEQELRRLQDESRPLLDFVSFAGRSSATLRPEEKIALFLELFGARRDIYPKFWESLSLGKKGYSPAYASDRGEWHLDRLVLPRGTLDDAITILESAGANVTIQDARSVGSRVSWAFHGELRPEQEAAVQEIAKHDYGVLCAPPGAGKTQRNRHLARSHTAAYPETRHCDATQPRARRRL